MKLHLTDLAVKKLSLPEDGQVTYWDDAMPGFGLRLSARSKSYVVMYGEKRQLNARIRWRETHQIRLVEKITQCQEKSAMWYSPEDHPRFREYDERASIIAELCSSSTPNDDRRNISHARDTLVVPCISRDASAPYGHRGSCSYPYQGSPRSPTTGSAVDDERLQRYRMRKHSQIAVFLEQSSQRQLGLQRLLRLMQQ